MTHDERTKDISQLSEDNRQSSFVVSEKGLLAMIEYETHHIMNDVHNIRELVEKNTMDTARGVHFLCKPNIIQWIALVLALLAFGIALYRFCGL